MRLSRWDDGDGGLSEQRHRVAVKTSDLRRPRPISPRVRLSDRNTDRRLRRDSVEQWALGPDPYHGSLNQWGSEYVADIIRALIRRRKSGDT